MGDDRSWLTSEYPELRDGPPWVMEDMILAQRGYQANAKTITVSDEILVDTLALKR